MLALRLKQNESLAAINAIKTESGPVTSDPVKINGAFQMYYSHLYKSELQIDYTAFKDFFNNVNLPKLTFEQSQILDSPLTLEELKEVLLLMQKGKAPGLGGLPPELFIEFWDIVGPLIS